MDDSPGDGHALLLSAAKFRGAMSGPMCEADSLERLDGPAGSLRAVDALKREGQRDVLQCGETGNQVIRLKNETDRRAAIRSTLPAVEGGQILFFDPDISCIRGIETAQDMQEGRFARAANAKNRYKLPLDHLEIHILQCPNLRRADVIFSR